MKSVGRLERAKKQKEDNAYIESGYDEVAKTLGVSSGKLCANGVFWLNHRLVKQLEAEDDVKRKKQQESHERKTAALDKDAKNFRLAASNYFNGMNLNIKDYWALLKKTAEPKDSPIRCRIKELEDQFLRQSDRMKSYNINNIDITHLPIH
jgi:hypothetical protein